MNEIKFEQLSDIVSGRKPYGFPEILSGQSVQKITIDSRQAENGDVYIPVKGVLHDGHRFIRDAIDHGASAFLSEQSLEETGLTEEELKDKGVLYIGVDSTLQALRDLAGYNRHQSDIPVVAITGSSGKTTTKDLIASVLSQKFNTLKTQGNLNNVFGVPRTLLEIGPETEAAVIEMGMDHRGEIEGSIEAVDPEIAVITNIGTAHLKTLGSRENILMAKAEILKTLDHEKTAILNGDDDMLRHINDSEFEVIRYGMEEDDLDRSAKDFSSNADGIRFTAFGKNWHLALPGRHNVYNALAAVTVGYKLGLSPSQIQAGLDAFRPSDHRMQLIHTGGMTLIDDSYNANPDSMKAALQALEDSADEKNRIVAILGDMLELGEDEIASHLELGREAASKVDYLIGVGPAAKNIIRGAISRKASMEGAYCKDIEEALIKVPSLLKGGDIVLIKGSHGVQLEKLVDALSADGGVK